MNKLALSLLVFIVPLVSAAERRVVVRNAGPAKSVSIRGNGSGLFRMGATLGFDGLLGKTATSDTAAKGLGYSFGLVGQIPFGDRYRLTLSPSYQYMRLGRAFDNSGQLQEPTPINVEQSVKSIGILGMGSMQVDEDADGGMHWWFDVGGQYLLPLSASQTVGASNTGFTAAKSLLLLAGATADYFMQSNMNLTFSAQLLVNMAGSSDGRFYGIRLLGGVTLRI